MHGIDKQTSGKMLNPLGDGRGLGLGSGIVIV